MAELDDDRRRLLLRLVDARPQVLITTANLDSFPQEFRDRATLLHVEEGTIAVQPPARARAS
jgi:recombinational DNA repair ATPase RecF